MEPTGKLGEHLLEEEPYCHVLLQKHKGTFCDRCFSRCDTLKKCAGCGSLWYCGKSCQKRDWTVHKLECKCLKQVLPKIPTDSVRLMLRIIITKQLDLPMNSPWSRTFDDLMTHVDEVRLDSERSEQFTKMLYTLNEYTGDVITLPSSSELLEIFGKMVINSFTISDGELNDVGTGIYLSGSMLDHSCKPNAVAIFHGCTLVVTATERIENFSPNKVFISYIDQLATYKERQTLLKQQYYFDCKCDRCTDNDYNTLMRSFKCPERNCDGAVCLSEGNEFLACRKCGVKEFSTVLKSGALKVQENCKTKLNEMEEMVKSSDWKKVYEMSKTLIQETRDVLHPMNVYNVKLLNKAFDAAVNEEEWTKACKYGEKNLDQCRYYYSKYSPHYALELFKVGKLVLYLQNLETALRYLTEAQDIIAVVYGTNHELYNNVNLFMNQCKDELRCNGDKA
ncbi:hypothetical protein ACF0H5_009133 [Mactra antiquata]